MEGKVQKTAKTAEQHLSDSITEQYYLYLRLLKLTNNFEKNPDYYK